METDTNETKKFNIILSSRKIKTKITVNCCLSLVKMAIMEKGRGPWEEAQSVRHLTLKHKYLTSMPQKLKTLFVTTTITTTKGKMQ